MKRTCGGGLKDLTLLQVGWLVDASSTVVRSRSGSLRLCVGQLVRSKTIGWRRSRLVWLDVVIHSLRNTAGREESELVGQFAAQALAVGCVGVLTVHFALVRERVR